MLKMNLLIAWRNLMRRKTYSAINVFGLALAIACCVLLFLFVHNELSYDSFHKNADHIFRVVSSSSVDKSKMSAITPSPLAPALRENYPKIVRSVRLRPWGGKVAHKQVEDRESFLLADPGFFAMFSFPLLRGNAETALQDRRAMVISAEMAAKYFGTEDPLFKTLTITMDGDYTFTVTGVAENVPENSSIRFDFVLPTSLIAELHGDDQLTSWRISNTETYIQLAPAANSADFEMQLEAIAGSNYPRPVKLRLQPLLDIHLNPDIATGMASTSQPVYSYMLSAIAALILLLACINFTNLSIGQSSSRLAEIGIRKVLGAQRSRLIRQFVGEAFLMSLLALALGLVLAAGFLPKFNALAKKNLSLNFGPMGALLLFGFLLAISLLAGSYPAFFLSRFHPVEVLKTKFKFTGGNAMSRVLIVFQFVLTIFLLICTLSLGKQLAFMQEKNLGFDDAQILQINIASEFSEAYKNEISAHSGVVGVARSSHPFRGSGGATYFFEKEGRDIRLSVILVDDRFVAVFGIPVVAGRNFDKKMATDATAAMLVNEAFMHEYGDLYRVGEAGPSVQGMKDPTIIGVVKDFNFKPLYEKIAPLAMVFESVIYNMYVKIHSENMRATLTFLEDKWREISPNAPFKYNFLDEYIDRQYKTEARWRAILIYSTGFAMLISAMGLLGLSLLAAVRRTKEIGIRKVVGATTAQIVSLISKDFIKLILVAIVLACPAAYIAVDYLLQNYAYHVENLADVFVLSGALVFGIAILVVSVQAYQKAQANPIEALRYE